MKARHATLGVLFLAAVWLNWFGDDPSGVTFVAPTERSDRPGVPARTVAAPASPPAILPLRARSELMGGVDDPEQVLFGSHSWTPPPPPPVEAKVEPPPKPVAPPLPFIYLGRKLENGKWEAFLARGGDTYVVREKSVIDGTYRAESITPTTLTITYLPLRQIQTMTIGGGE
jgi:hypothetical protein